ncbi:LysR family transcriptional regulator [Aurantiacibacter xanthus]|nr:LysR family transcriptional regulator [Aurantiacibacter xanthus]
MRSGRLRDLNLNHLLTLDAVLEHRNLTRAAEQLDVTQGAISQSLSRLRSFFNDELLVRVGNAMEPTALASSLQGPVAEVLGSIESSILAKANFDPLTAQGTLNICMTDLGEFIFLSELQSRLAQAAPNMSIATRALPDTDLAGYMAKGKIDLAFAGPIDEVADLKVQKILEHELVALVSRECPLPDRITAEEYVSLPHVVFDSPYIKRVRIEQTMARMGLTRQIALRTPNALSQPFLLERNPNLIVTVPRILAERMARVLPLRVLQLDFEVPRLDVFQYWHPRFDRHGPSQWLRKLVVELCAEIAH